MNGCTNEFQMDAKDNWFILLFNVNLSSHESL